MKKKIGLIISLLVLIGVVMGVVKGCNGYEEPVIDELDPNVSVGHRPDKPKEEIEEEKNLTTDGYAFDVYVNPEIELKDGNSLGVFDIENIEQNNYLMRVEMTLMKTGEVIYNSGIIDTNRHIHKARLSKFLMKGKHPVLTTFIALDKETLQEVGRVNREINIYINENPQA